MYPPETVVAEKFEAMISCGLANTRLKDFYDLWVIARSLEFELSTLVDAVGGTLQRRETPTPNELPVALLDSFAAVVDANGRWRRFVQNTRPSLPPPPFPEVQAALRGFFGRVIESLAAPEVARGRWDRHAGWVER
jgi:hypothetical protein